MIRVQAEDFDAGALLNEFMGRDTAVGAVASFTGLVRADKSETAEDAEVRAMTLEHYPGMTERQLADIEAEARDRWPLADVLIVHRYGRMEPGDRIVFVAVAAAHRKAAFEACEFLMDWLKTKAPFWKLEERPDGSQWVDARETDSAAARRWER